MKILGTRVLLYKDMTSVNLGEILFSDFKFECSINLENM